jgi:hypothetical protein
MTAFDAVIYLNSMPTSIQGASVKHSHQHWLRHLPHQIQSLRYHLHQPRDQMVNFQLSVP